VNPELHSALFVFCGFIVFLAAKHNLTGFETLKTWKKE
jgi:hypothetical protein